MAIPLLPYLAIRRCVADSCAGGLAHGSAELLTPGVHRALLGYVCDEVLPFPPAEY